MPDTTALSPALPTLSLPRVAVFRPAVVAAIAGAALAIRLVHLSATGFNEDEINKWNAVQAYARGDFAPNAEHPMLMKLAAWASVSAARTWNAHPALAEFAVIAPESALRLPNAIAGSAIAVVLFLLGESLFGTLVGLWAAAFWALDVNAAALNRVAKEDTLVVLFLLTAAYLHERKRTLACHAAFGLMLACKYMPHYFGLHAAYGYAADPAGRIAPPGRAARNLAVLGAVFLAANFTLLRPETWAYLADFVHGDTMRHTGYVFADRIYVNAIGTSPWGQPVWFYLAYFAAKVPLVVLALAAWGLAWTWKHPRDRGAMFIRFLLVPTLLAYSLISGKFLRYMAPVLALIDLAAAIGMAALMRRIAAPALAAAAILLLLAVNVAATAPFYSLAQNLAGAVLVAPGSLFPDDEFLDAGVRESVGFIARAAAPNAVVCGETPGVVAEYLRRSGRLDVAPCSLSRDGVPMHAADVWVIVQDGHVYFENELTIDAIRRRLRPVATFQVRGATAAEVYRLHGAAR
jgi:dolichyl-phosphate-mannose-protein mannosyltransferase